MIAQKSGIRGMGPAITGWLMLALAFSTGCSSVMAAESEVSMAQLCPKNDPPDYQGVLWVTYDRIVLRDCESTAVAYRAIGGYSGVDALAKKLVTYLKTAPPLTTTAQ
jgi:hypothetical protein